MIDAGLLEILVCPKCRSAVELREKPADGQTEEWLVCRGAGCGLRYPVRDGVPIMLIDEASPPERRA